MVKLEWNTENIIGALRKVYGENSSTSKSEIDKWITCFKEDEEQIGRPSTSVYKGKKDQCYPIFNGG